MSNTQPKDNWDHIADFFFGSPKNVKRTFLICASIAVIVYIDELITTAQMLVLKIANMFIELMPALIIVGIFYVLFKKVFGKK